MEIVTDTEITDITYRLTIDFDIFKKLIDQELEYQMDFDKRLAALGAIDVEYNGHFGNSIYFRVDAANHSKTVRSIKSFITKELKKL